MQQVIPFDHTSKLIISVYDYSEVWVKPYIDAGYPVMCWDLKHEGCMLRHFDRLLSSIDEAIDHGYFPYGLLAAPPCTHFSKAAAWCWNKQDQTMADDDDYPETSMTELYTMLVDLVAILRERYDFKFWALENPPGRIEKLCTWLKPYRKMMFRPYDFGDDMTKHTILWGEFNTDLRTSPITPTTVTMKGKNNYYKASPFWAKTGGKSEKVKAMRSNTPPGFAKAFFAANQ